MAPSEIAGTVIVTGAAAGIGAGITQHLLALGWQVLAADRNADSLEQLAGRHAADKERLLTYQVDISEPDQVAACMQACIERFGAPTALINNAGLTGEAVGSVLDLTPQRWRHILSVNLDGAFYFAGEVSRRLVAEGRPGRIVNIGSVNSFAAEKDSAAYVAAKGGIWMLTRSMAVDLAPFGILVNCIAPGPIEKESNRDRFQSEPGRTAIRKNVPLGRPGTPAEIAEVAAFLLAPGNTYLTGSCLVVDGGATAYLRSD